MSTIVTTLLILGVIAFVGYVALVLADLFRHSH